MTFNEFKKAVKKSVEQFSYASEIMKAMRVDEYHANGKKLSHANAAIIVVHNDIMQRREYRVYYNFSTMNNKIEYALYENYPDACDGFMKIV